MAALDDALGWKDCSISNNYSIAANYWTLKERGHQLAMENEHIRSFISISTSNIVGPNGFPFQSKLKMKGRGSKNLDATFNENFERIKKQMGKSYNCYTADGAFSEKMLDAFIWRLICVEGEAIIIHQPTSKNEYGITKKIIDPCLLDHDLNGALPNGNFIKMGIEVDSENMPIAYHFRQNNDREPLFAGMNTQSQYEHVRIAASQVTHLFFREFVGQMRGLSMFIASGPRAHMINMFHKATVISATISMGRGHFYKLNHEAAEQAGVLGGLGEHDDEDGDYNINQEAAMPEYMEFGQGEILPSYVEGIERLSHEFPPANYEEFSRVNLKSLAAGLPIQYHTLTGDYAEVNFSSARMAELEQRPLWIAFQNFLKEEWKEVSLKKEAEILQFSQGKVLDSDKLNRCVSLGYYRFGSRGWDYTNPLDAARANSENLKNRLTTRGQILRETRGDIDFDEHLEEFAIEERKMKEAGIDPFHVDAVAPQETEPENDKAKEEEQNV